MTKKKKEIAVKKVLTIRAEGNEAKLIEQLCKETGCKSASKALLYAAQVYLNVIPDLRSKNKSLINLAHQSLIILHRKINKMRHYFDLQVDIQRENASTDFVNLEKELVKLAGTNFIGIGIPNDIIDDDFNTGEFIDYEDKEELYET